MASTSGEVSNIASPLQQEIPKPEKVDSKSAGYCRSVSDFTEVPRTPAIFEGLAPWGPTPSPTVFVRMPRDSEVEDFNCIREDECDYRYESESKVSRQAQQKAFDQDSVNKSDGCGVGGDLGRLEFTPELLMEICAPHIQRMISALYEVVERQLVLHTSSKQALNDETQSPQEDLLVSMRKKQSDSPFGALFDVAGTSRRSDSPVSEKRFLDSLQDDMPHEATSSSLPKAGEGKVALGIDTSTSQASRQCKANPFDNADGDSKESGSTLQPMWLLRANGGIQVSPLLPSTTPQIPKQSSGNLVLTVAETQLQQRRACGSKEVTTAAMPNSGESLGGAAPCEKSAMVCRHWKSKGWCRLEDTCRFLHPEHKRGGASAAGAPQTSTAAGGAGGGSSGSRGAGGCSKSSGSAGGPSGGHSSIRGVVDSGAITEESLQEGAVVPSVGKGTVPSNRSSHRSGRGRKSAGTGADVTLPPAAMAVGLLPTMCPSR